MQRGHFGLAVHKRVHTRQRRRRYVGEFPEPVIVFRGALFPVQERLAGGIPAPLGVPGAFFGDDGGAEGDEGHHDDGDAGFDLVPQDGPDDVFGGASAGADAGHADRGDDDHDEVQA